jgi:hypothetical protein
MNKETLVEAARQLDALNRQAEIEYVIICPGCKKAFNSGAAFRYHYETQHEITTDPDEVNIA